MSNAKQNYHRLKLRARRKLRKQKRQAREAVETADHSLDRLVFRRISRLFKVRRFVSVWVILLVFIGFGVIWQVRGLDKYYLSVKPAAGGIYREGLIGTFTTSNPMFAVTAADSSVAKLVFSGLFKLSPAGVLEPDLATKFTVDDKGLVYTVSLRTDVKWHDGEVFNAEDVIFTYNRIKSPGSKSPLTSSWRDVKIESLDDYTVVFTLPNALAPFKFSMTNGIVPEHALRDIDTADLRSSIFNTKYAVGTGPFKYKSVEVIGNDIDDRQEKITLETYEDYHRENAKIDGIVIRTYDDEESMIKAFTEQEITSMTGLRTVPDEFKLDSTVKAFSTPMRSSVMVFMNNSNEILKSKEVRKALVQGTNTDALREALVYQLLEVDSPFLRSHFSYDETKVQLPFNPVASTKALEQAGWVLGDDGVREKDGVRLKLRLVSQSLPEYSIVAQGIQEQWSEIGVEVEAILQSEKGIQSSAVSRHDYDVLLYGTAIGPDPDVFAYWHSSQFDQRLKSRLNLAEFKSEAADTALEAGRTRTDEDLRKIKYEPFLDAWVSDAPAIGIYQPRFLFIARGILEGYRTGQFSDPTDRYYSVTQWRVRQKKMVN